MCPQYAMNVGVFDVEEMSMACIVCWCIRCLGNVNNIY